MSGFPMRYRTGQCNLGNHPLCSWATCTCTCHQPAEPAAPGLRGASRGEAAAPAVADAPGGAERMLGVMLGPVPGALPPSAATAALDDPERQAASRAACLANWPEAEAMGYHPRCCRFPKSCSVEDPVDTENPQVSAVTVVLSVEDFRFATEYDPERERSANWREMVTVLEEIQALLRDNRVE